MKSTFFALISLIGLVSVSIGAPVISSVVVARSQLSFTTAVTTMDQLMAHVETLTADISMCLFRIPSLINQSRLTD